MKKFKLILLTLFIFVSGLQAQNRKAMFFKQSTTVDNPFKFKVLVSASENIPLPLDATGTYNFTVNYGDGLSGDLSVTAFDDSNANYTYPNAGTFEISINGVCEGFIVSDDVNIDTNITDITQWGDVGFTRLQFKGCTNMVVSATDTLDTSLITSFVDMFRTCTSLGTITNIDDWDVSNVTTMSFMFNLSGYSGSIDSWNTSSVTNMQSMFNNADSFNSSIDSWDVSNVTSFNGMFSNAAIYNQSMNSWTLNSVSDINMSSMFAGALSFAGNIASWNTTKVTSMASMFNNCDNFNINIGSWVTTNVTTMASMFVLNSGFNQDISSWDVSSVLTMNSMFNNADAFNQDISGWTVTSCTNFANCFRNQTLMNQALTWDISAATNMNDMLRNSAFSDANWDSMLIFWAALSPPPSNITIGCNATHTAAADAAVTTLTTTYSWIINEGI